MKNLKFSDYVNEKNNFEAVQKLFEIIDEHTAKFGYTDEAEAEKTENYMQYLSEKAENHRKKALFIYSEIQFREKYRALKTRNLKKTA